MSRLEVLVRAAAGAAMIGAGVSGMVLIGAHIGALLSLPPVARATLGVVGFLVFVLAYVITLLGARTLVEVACKTILSDWLAQRPIGGQTH